MMAGILRLLRPERRQFWKDLLSSVKEKRSGTNDVTNIDQEQILPNFVFQFSLLSLSARHTLKKCMLY